MRIKVVIRSGGDLASAVIQKLHRVGMAVLVLEKPTPTVVRRTVSFSNAIYEGRYTVEGIEAIYCETLDCAHLAIQQGKIPVLTLEAQEVFEGFKPDVFVDATLSKQPVTYEKSLAKAVIGLGPEIIAGENAHIVIETARGHDLGRLIFEGKAQDNSSMPGDIGGYNIERVLYAPCEGVLLPQKEIGDLILADEVVAMIGDLPIRSQINGILRGLIHPSVKMQKGLKIGDVDPRGALKYCYSISDKGRAIAGGVLEAILIRMKEEESCI